MGEPDDLDPNLCYFASTPGPRLLTTLEIWSHGTDKFKAKSRAVEDKSTSCLGQCLAFTTIEGPYSQTASSTLQTASSTLHTAIKDRDACTGIRLYLFQRV